MENVTHSNRRLFQRVYPNTCPECGHDTLWLIEYGCTKNRLNDQGFVCESHTDGYENKLQCANCGKEYHNVEKIGMCYKIKPELPKIRKVMEAFNPFQS